MHLTQLSMMKKYMNYYNLSDTEPLADGKKSSKGDHYNNTPIKWIHLTDSSMRIEAIISGQAIMTNQPIPPMSNLTQTVAIQPKSLNANLTACNEYYITSPLPHTIVVIKHITSSSSSRYKQEKRSRRAGRLSRRFISDYITHLPDDDECCTACPISLICCCFRSTHGANQPVMC
jgi:hypothetical protein